MWFRSVTAIRGNANLMCAMSLRLLEKTWYYFYIFVKELILNIPVLYFSYFLVRKTKTEMTKHDHCNFIYSVWF